MKSQAAMEYVAILGIVLVATIPFFYYAISESNSNIKVNQADDAVQTIAKAADAVYSLGPGAKNYVWITIPNDVENGLIYNNTVQLNLRVGNHISELTGYTKANMIGNFPYLKGTYKIPVEMLDSGYVLVGEANDTKPPVVLWTSPSGVVCSTYTILRATTNEPSTCKWATIDMSYSLMTNNFIGTSFSHEDIRGYQSDETSYAYYVRCQDAFGNNMSSSAIISYTINQSSCGGSGNATNGTFATEYNPPIVILISPKNNTLINTSLINFTFNVTDESNIILCELITNETKTQPVATDTTITRNISQNISYSLNTGNYTWSINCTDAHGNKGNSTTWLVKVNATIDSDAPIIKLIMPLNNSNRTFNLINFIYNVSDASSGISFCSLNIYTVFDGGSSSSLSVIDSTVEELPKNNSLAVSLDKGNHTWNISCMDNSPYFNIGYSESRKLRINTTQSQAFISSCVGWCSYYYGFSGGECKNTYNACLDTCNPDLGSPNCYAGDSVSESYCTGGESADECCCIP